MSAARERNRSGPVVPFPRRTRRGLTSASLVVIAIARVATATRSAIAAAITTSVAATITAATTASIATTAAATITTTATRTRWTFSARTRFVDGNASSYDFLLMQRFNCSVGFHLR